MGHHKKHLDWLPYAVGKGGVLKCRDRFLGFVFPSCDKLSWVAEVEDGRDRLDYFPTCAAAIDHVERTVQQRNMPLFLNNRLVIHNHLQEDGT